ncbi:hypothetical protein SNE40_018473 [Patella caerulea]|uniref:BHLH domain-containing protein n=1 Tax=Patella caerulea TaxID=87958 RepID=A0AAN8P7X7_PATCE
MAVTHYWNEQTCGNGYHSNLPRHQHQTTKMLPNANLFNDNIHRTVDTILKDKIPKERNKNRKSPYRHIPHSQKPPHLVAKRNARERRRVQAVNSAFSRLRKHVPYEPRHKRLSKVKTLQFAIDYIHNLQDLISDHDEKVRLLQATINHRQTNYHSDMFTDSQQTSWIAQISNDVSKFKNIF